MGCFANVAEINLLHHFQVFEIAAPLLRNVQALFVPDSCTVI